MNKISRAPENFGGVFFYVSGKIFYASCANHPIMAALGMDCSDLQELPTKNFVSSYIVHSLKDGIFKSLHISDAIKRNVILCDLFVKPGEKIYRFENGGFGIGAMLLKFDSVAEMNQCIDNMEDYVECVLTEETPAASNTLCGGVANLTAFRCRVSLAEERQGIAA